MAPSSSAQEQNRSLPNSQDQHLPQAEDSYDGPEPSLTESDDLHVREPEPTEDEDGHLPLPVWMRESSKAFRWKWVPLPLRRFVRSINHYAFIINRWSYGPGEARIQRIEPFFPIVQEIPLWLVERFLPKRLHRIIALVFFYLAWLLTFCLIIRESAASGNIEGYGVPNSIWCGANFW